MLYVYVIWEYMLWHRRVVLNRDTGKGLGCPFCHLSLLSMGRIMHIMGYCRRLIG